MSLIIVNVTKSNNGLYKYVHHIKVKATNVFSGAVFDIVYTMKRPSRHCFTRRFCYLQQFASAH